MVHGPHAGVLLRPCLGVSLDMVRGVSVRGCKKAGGGTAGEYVSVYFDDLDLNDFVMLNLI